MLDLERGRAKDMDETLTVVIPAFNERDSLERNLPHWLAWCASQRARLIVVDDGSSDGSLEVLARHLRNRRLRVLRHRSNRGYGEAVKTGIYRAESAYVATMDADGQHDIEDTGALLAVLLDQDADLVIGSRANATAGSAYRRLGKTVIRSLARALFRARIRDLNSGMKVYRTPLAQRLLPFCPSSMAFSDVITLTHLNQNCLVIEAPIQVRPRKTGQSTINTMTAVETVVEIVNVLVGFRPLKVFLPLSGLLIAAGGLWAVPFLALGRGLSGVALMLITTGFMAGMVGLLAEQVAAARRVDLSDVAAREVTSRR
jgi:hypothetical protein